MDPRTEIRRLLETIYGKPDGQKAWERIAPLLDDFSTPAPEKGEPFSEKDVVLITYGDSLRKPSEAPLKTLVGFARRWFADVFSTIHLLPFYPWSSDDGFSVIDFFSVDPAVGTWEDVGALRSDFSLMFDFVLNHISSQSPWFMRYLAQEAGYRDLAIEVPPGQDLSRVTRPRSLPLLTPVKKFSGQTVSVWTTFSADQIDLNYGSLDVLERMIRVMLFYVRQGARLLRMDAVAYLWKRIGTSCIHLAETHAMVKLFRKILDAVSPETLIITETNVPHEENLRYFGSGGDEAQLVYNFTLPPLLFHAFLRQDASALSRWARTLALPHPQNTFFNFTASHDGIGVRPLEGILPKEETGALIDAVLKGGGQVSYKDNPDGSRSPYELNIAYVEAMRFSREDPAHALRFLASQSIALVLPGVPAVYIHSALGSGNWTQGVAETGRARTINREKLQVDSLEKQLRDPTGLRSRIFHPYMEMIRLRKRQKAFHPNAEFAVIELDPRVFSIVRQRGGQRILAATNLSGQPVAIPAGAAGFAGPAKELLSHRTWSGAGPFELPPYGIAWLSEKGETEE